MEWLKCRMTRRWGFAAIIAVPLQRLQGRVEVGVIGLSDRSEEMSVVYRRLVRVCWLIHTKEMERVPWKHQVALIRKPCGVVRLCLCSPARVAETIEDKVSQMLDPIATLYRAAHLVSASLSPSLVNRGPSPR